MAFSTRLDYSNNRQIKQRIETITVLSGATVFGIPFNLLPTGPNLSLSSVTEDYASLVSSYSGNSATTVYSWADSRMSNGAETLEPLTPAISGFSQDVEPVFSAASTTIIDGNYVVLNWSGAQYDIIPLTMVDLGGGNYSGTVFTNEFEVVSAATYDFSGRTIWVDVCGITRTENLIITKTPVIGNVWTCIDNEGKGAWSSPISGGSSGITNNLYWVSGSSGAYSVKRINNSGLDATGGYSYAEGNNTLASGSASHAEGNGTIASGDYSHAEGYGTKAESYGSHAEGYGTTASGSYGSHAEGFNTIASGDNSHAGGANTKSIGVNSFIHSFNSVVTGNRSVVLGGQNITGTTDDYVYIPSLNIKNIASSAFANDIRIDAIGNLTTNTSDINFKENINDISDALNKIKQLRGVSYQWKDKIAGGDAIKLGFIAQEVQLVEPSLVFTNKHDGYLGIHNDGILPLLVEAVKELANIPINYSSTTLTTQTILAEDNDIILNYNGTHETALDGGITIEHGIKQGQHSTLKIDDEGNFIMNTGIKSKFITIPDFTPKSSDDNTDNIGNITKDDDYFYIKTSNGIWKRFKLETF